MLHLETILSHSAYEWLATVGNIISLFLAKSHHSTPFAGDKELMYGLIAWLANGL